MDEGWNIDVFYLEHSILQEEERQYVDYMVDDPSQHKTDWSSDNDSYLFYFHPVYCDLEIHNSSPFLNPFNVDTDANIVVGYGKEGIEYLHLHDIFELEASGQAREILQSETAVEPLIKRYESIKDGSTNEFESISLCCDIKSSTVVPCWCVIVRTTDERGIHKKEIRINALTGEFM